MHAMVAGWSEHSTGGASDLVTLEVVQGQLLLLLEIKPD